MGAWEGEFTVGDVVVRLVLGIGLTWVGGGARRVDVWWILFIWILSHHLDFGYA